jgi:CRISPR-associated endonuclease/helicase Cas3
MQFEEMFEKATNLGPLPFQRRFASELYGSVDVPTGLGKTAMAVLGWLWRRRFADAAVRARSPRRLVYCLPMRVLVEQTRENVVAWLHNLGLLAGHPEFDERCGKKALRSYTPNLNDCAKIAVNVLMGGEGEADWDIHPECDTIIIGTQDMLLSRALNRGYAASRARWPMQFGLLHTDCLWVFDEIQLMGSGLATTAQLEAFRHLLGSKDGHGCRSVWMSATMQSDWLRTVDFKDRVDELLRLDLNADDRKNNVVIERWTATKPLEKAGTTMGDATALAKEICDAHKPGTRTIVVANTVQRASKLHAQIKKQWSSGDTQRLVLLHSRFRPADRKTRVEEALADPPAGGTILVSTQVIEAGVDVSATTLFTALAPWASLVQRFGRCNRKGEIADASVRWIDVPDKDAAPYDPEDLITAREQLGKLEDVGIKSLSDHPVALPFLHTHVIRQRDLIDLFDTTPDLAGSDIDIDRFVRDMDETDVQVFWRDYDKTPNEIDGKDVEPAPLWEELCSARVGEFRDFAKKHSSQIWRWNFLDQKWEKANTSRIAPGPVYLVHSDTGGYTRDRGWDPGSATRVEPMIPPTDARLKSPDATDDEPLSRIGVWQTIAHHTDEVCSEIDSILSSLSPSDEQMALLRVAARWHDWGKAHEVFRGALPDGVPDASMHWAKAVGTWKRYSRRHFRHELASALALLQRPHVSFGAFTDEDLNLIAFLIAAHHGKVRLSIRSLPNETRPPATNGTSRRFARSVWDGDELPETDLGGSVIAPAVALSLEPMELGLCEEAPFAGQPSWAERTIRLRDTLGPFRLAYLEAILRAADWRASAKAEPHKTSGEQTAVEVDHA